MRSFSEGWGRVRSAPALLVGVYAMTVVLALPLAITMRGLLQTHLGASLAAEGAANGVNYDWWQEFTSQATGIGTTFSPTIIGFAATLDNISSLLDGQREIAPIAGALTLYLLAWTFLVGGIIDRYARQRPIRAAGFFAASGVHVFRLLRLAIVSGLVYWWLFAYVRPWLFLEWFADRTRTMSVERDVFFWRVALYLLFGALLVVVNVIFDYAKIRIVVEDRRSALGALSAGMRFVWRQRGRVAALYALNGLAFLILIAIWAFDLADSNLPTRLAFPLLVARTVRDLTPTALPASITAGAPLALRPDPRASTIDVSGPAGIQATVAVSSSTEIDALTLPGFYRLEERAGGATIFRGQVAVNAGAAIESDLRPRSALPSWVDSRSKPKRSRQALRVLADCSINSAVVVCSIRCCRRNRPM